MNLDDKNVYYVLYLLCPTISYIILLCPIYYHTLLYQCFVIFALITDVEFRCQECLLCPTYYHILLNFCYLCTYYRCWKEKKYFIDGMIVRVVMLTKEGVEVGGGVDGEQFPGLDWLTGLVIVVSAH